MPRAHEDGSVEQIVEEALAFPPPAVRRRLSSAGRRLPQARHGRPLPQIAAPTLVLAGEFNIIFPPRFGRFVAAEIPNARFEAMPGEAHQPFQEVPDEFNARVDSFLPEVEARG
jgi:pimeloyl-ACP methyl ester carboxylesterase